MKTKFLLLIMAVATMAWSCSDSCDNDAPVVDTSRTVATVAEAQAALNEGVRNITISNALAAPATFNIPGNYPVGTNVKLDLNANNNNVTINQATTGGTQFPSLNLLTDDADVVIINTPNMSVFYEGNAQRMEATTAANTLTILKGSIVSDLTLHAGGLRLYGTVSNMTNSGNGKFYLAIGPGSDRPISNTLIKESLETAGIGGLILTEGKYPLMKNMATDSDYEEAAGELWYMPINKEGFELLGDGNRDNIIVYGNEYSANGAWSSQNTVTVFANNVTFDNITFKVKDESNKTIEVLGSNFHISNCAFVPNNEITNQNQNADGGSLYFTSGAIHNNGGGRSDVTGAVVENCYFRNATLSVDNMASGTITGAGNVFDGANHFGKVISTRNWRSDVDVTNSTMNVTLNNTTVRNILAYAGNPDPAVPGSYAAFTVDYGTVSLTNSVLPSTTSTYWAVTGNGTFAINGVNHTAPAQPQP